MRNCHFLKKSSSWWPNHTRTNHADSSRRPLSVSVLEKNARDALGNKTSLCCGIMYSFMNMNILTPSSWYGFCVILKNLRNFEKKVTDSVYLLKIFLPPTSTNILSIRLVQYFRYRISAVPRRKTYWVQEKYSVFQSKRRKHHKFLEVFFNCIQSTSPLETADIAAAQLVKIQ